MAEVKRERGAMMRKVMLLVLAGLLGCSTMGPIATDEEQLVMSAGDLGAVGCAGLVAAGKPSDVAQARRATALAESILASETPTMTALTAALAASDLPPQYRAVASIVVTRVSARLGTADPIPKDHVAFKMAEAFVDSCGAILGVSV